MTTTAIRERINHAANGQLFPDEIDKLEALLQEVERETAIKIHDYRGKKDFHKWLDDYIEALTRGQHGDSK